MTTIYFSIELNRLESIFSMLFYSVNVGGNLLSDKLLVVHKSHLSLELFFFMNAVVSLHLAQIM